MVATRRVKKRRHVKQTVLNNDASEVPVHSSPRLPPPTQPPPTDTDDIREPPEKVAKMEKGSEESDQKNNERDHGNVSRNVHSHMTPLSPEDHHGRPPTPPETPENHQHIHMHNISMEETKCEDMSGEEDDINMEVDTNAITPSDDTIEDDETMMGDQDSEAPLEVDTSHETEPELEIEVETNDRTVKESEQHCLTDDSQNDLCSEENGDEIDVDEPLNDSCDVADQSPCEHTFDNETDTEDSVDVKPIRRVRRNVVIQASQDGSCAFSDTDEEPMDESGALDLSDHARSVREARARGGIDLSRVQGTQTMLSITQSKTPKKKNKSNNSSACGGTQSGSPLNWPPSNPTHAATFHDLLTLSQAAVLQLAIVQRRAQEEAKKSIHANSTGNMNDTSDTLSFINGSGDTLTISAINNNKNEDGENDDEAPISSDSEIVNGSVGNGGKVLRSTSLEANYSEEQAVSNTITISRAGKHGTLKSKLNKSPLHKSSAHTDNLKIPIVTNPSNKINNGRSKSVEKDNGSERTGDPIFKITNQKLSECYRQQMNNKLKHNNNKAPSTKNCLSPGSSQSNTKETSLLSTSKTLQLSTSKSSQSSVQKPLSSNVSRQSQSSKSPNSTISPKTTNTPIFKKQQEPSSSKQHLSSQSNIDSQLFQSSVKKLSSTSVSSSTNVSLPKTPVFSGSRTEAMVLTPSSVTKTSAASCSRTLATSTATTSRTQSMSTSTTIRNHQSSNIAPLSRNHVNSASAISSTTSVTKMQTPSISKPQSTGGTTAYRTQAPSAPRPQATTVPSISRTQTISNTNNTPKPPASSNGVPKSTNPISTLALSAKYSQKTGTTTSCFSKSTILSPSQFPTPVTITPIASPSSHVNIPRPAPLNIPRSIYSNISGLNSKGMTNGVNQYKSVSNFNRCSSYSTNSLINSINNSKTNISSTNKINSLSSHNTISFTALRTPSMSTSIGRSLATPIRSVLSSNGNGGGGSNSCSSSINSSGVGSSNTALRTNTTNSAPVRATNSSVRQIPNPSLLHQQSESRLTGGTRLGSVLSRLGTGGATSSGISRIESLTRTLHEKAAGAAAAAINTAAR